MLKEQNMKKIIFMILLLGLGYMGYRLLLSSETNLCSGFRGNLDNIVFDMVIIEEESCLPCNTIKTVISVAEDCAKCSNREMIEIQLQRQAESNENILCRPKLYVQNGNAAQRKLHSQL